MKYKKKQEMLDETMKELEEEIEKNKFLILSLKGQKKILEITWLGQDCPEYLKGEEKGE